jgi:hypothetical protein
MIAFMLFLATLSPTRAARRCEEHGPRLDGSYVTICDGSVVRVRDRLGNVREWLPGGTIVVLRSPGSATTIVGGR